MINTSFHLAFWTVLFFVLGMIKPKWPLFFLKEPSRFIVMVITIVLTMISITLYGEGNRQKQMEAQEKIQPVAEDIAPVVDAAPAVVETAPDVAATTAVVVPDPATIVESAASAAAEAPATEGAPEAAAPAVEQE